MMDPKTYSATSLQVRIVRHVRVQRAINFSLPLEPLYPLERVHHPAQHRMSSLPEL
jgi:hypothetical protein